MFEAFKNFCSQLVQSIKRQFFVIAGFAALGIVIGVANVLSTKTEFRQEMLIRTNGSASYFVEQINFLDASGSGTGMLGDELGLDEEHLSAFHDLKATRLRDTSLNMVNIRYSISDTSKVSKIDQAVWAYLKGNHPDISLDDKQLFQLPDPGIRSVVGFLFTFLSIGLVIAMFREARSQ